MSNYTANPSEQGGGNLWFVWDAEQGLPPRPVFVGSMEECGLVVDLFKLTELPGGPGEES